MKRWKMIAAAALFAASCSPQPETPPAAPPAVAPAAADLPAGNYVLDRAHATLLFRVNHIGFSMYTASFSDWQAELELDPAAPDRASITAAIDVQSLTLPSPPAGFRELLLGPDWFDAARYSQITFRSTSVTLTGADSARITGDLTLRGVTRPITLDARFNGGYAGHPMDPNARIGFSAQGVFKRSDFGMGLGVPPPGSTMGVSDEVEVVIETEFNGPAWSQPQPQQQAP